MSELNRDPKIPQSLAERPEFISACGDRDMRAVFKLAGKYGGLSTAAMGRMTGLGPSRIREVLNGTRTIKGFDVIEAISDGLGIPGALLGLADRPWEASLGRPPEGPAVVPIQPWELADILTRTTVAPVALDQIESTAMGAATRYPSTPPGQLLPLVQSLTKKVYEILSGTSSLKVKRQSVRIASILSGISGHLHLDLGDRLQAGYFYEVGIIAGQEAEDDGLVAWVLAMQSIGQFFEGSPESAISALEEASRLTLRGGNPRRHAWVTAQLARAYATGGHSSQALACLDQAAAALEIADGPEKIDFFDEARLIGISGTCNLLIGRPSTAIHVLTTALSERAPGDHKGRALLTMDLASCQIAMGQIEEACATADTALNIASDSLVQPIAIRAQSLRRELQPWQAVESVRAFGERLRADVGSQVMLEG